MSYRRFLLCGAVLSAFSVGAGGFVWAQDYREGQRDVVIERIDDGSSRRAGGIFELLEAGRVDGAKIEHLDALRSFYLKRDFDGYWVDGKRPNSNAKDLLAFLEKSWTHGLNPYSYHLEDIRALYAKRGNKAAMQALEVLMSDAYVSYGQDLTGIRVNPAKLKSHTRYWQQPYKASSLMELLDQDDDAEDVVESFTPRGATYNRLRKELIRLAGEGPETYEAVLPIKMRGLLRPYEQHKAVKDLRLRFGMGVENASLVYDDALAAQVMAFQVANGLDADGVIGPATLRALNKTRRHKMHQIIANLERLRWVEEAKPDKFVIVNIPSAMLWAVDDGRVAFDMPVIVGRTKRATNIFITEITGVRLNPTWTVPPTIKREDILPKLIQDSNYLTNKGMELVHGYGADALTLDPTAIDWTTVTNADLKNLRMIQNPGAHNPLGYVRVLMPNGYNIYLHDTNEKHYFDKPGRAASSGCIRMKRPMDIAEFILSDKPGWSDEKTQQALNSGKLKDIYIPETIPVYLLYYTAWVDQDGEIVFGNDLYGYDDDIIKMLSKLDEIFIPVDNTGNVRSVSAQNDADFSGQNL
jgi:murein L,D-transpeptidase YcbB/YkuD